jgi:4-hydroxythreonine-4-phosphate dehydrogenase
MKPRIAITLGDPSGIGPEIVSKAVVDRRVLSACTPVLVGDPAAFALHRRPLPSVELLSVPVLNRRLPLGKPSREAGRSAIESIKLGVSLVRSAQALALVTAPASKESFHLAGLGFPGHTEYLADEAGAKVAMLMVAGELRTILLTRHVPLVRVAAHLSREDVFLGAALGIAFVRRSLKRPRPRVVLCGINPHAGDHGLIGREEDRLLRPALQRLRGKVVGPIAADTVFRDMAAGKYDLALAAYHDQGMIPLKLYAPERLVNITLGLPYIRTSPGHGTAHDIAGRNKGDPRPMIEAILLAAKYCRSS